MPVVPPVITGVDLGAAPSLDGLGIGQVLGGVGRAPHVSAIFGSCLPIAASTGCSKQGRGDLDVKLLPATIVGH
jgi:hypothetical protein